MSISNPTIQLVAQILAKKVMKKFCVDEVMAPVVSLVAQCVKEVLFNWSRYLCQEFLTNCREAQDETKPFHYTWLLLSIVLVAWEQPRDSQFPPLEEGLSEVVEFALLWATKDPA